MKLQAGSYFIKTAQSEVDDLRPGERKLRKCQKIKSPGAITGIMRALRKDFRAIELYEGLRVHL